MSQRPYLPPLSGVPRVSFNLSQLVAAFERKYLNELLTASGGNAALGARTAGMHVSALWAALRKYGIRPQKRPPPAQ